MPGLYQIQSNSIMHHPECRSSSSSLSPISAKANPSPTTSVRYSDADSALCARYLLTFFRACVGSERVIYPSQGYHPIAYLSCYYTPAFIVRRILAASRRLSS